MYILNSINQILKISYHLDLWMAQRTITEMVSAGCGHTVPRGVSHGCVQKDLLVGQGH